MTKSELKNQLEKSVEYLENELSQIRTGRANPTLIENIKVAAYGAQMAIRELGSITVLDSRNLRISPWDKSLSDSIMKAIRESDLNLNPVDDSNDIRIPLPDLTEERRREFVKVVSAKVEEVRNSIRNVRQDAMKDIDDQFQKKEISEDDKFTLREEVEEMVKEYTQKAVTLGDSKEADVMKV